MRRLTLDWAALCWGRMWDVEQPRNRVAGFADAKKPLDLPGGAVMRAELPAPPDGARPILISFRIMPYEGLAAAAHRRLDC